MPLRRSKVVGASEVTVGSKNGSLVWKQGNEIAIRASLTGKSRVSIAGAPVIFVGYGVTAPERGWDDYKEVDVRGKVLVALMNDPDFETGSGPFGGKAMTWYGRSTYKYEEAARRGAIGVLLVHEHAALLYGWATTRNSNIAEVFDVEQPDAAKTHPLMEAWIQRSAADESARRAGQDFESLRVAARSPTFRPVQLTGVTLSTDHRVDTSLVTSHNVVACLPGVSRPDEYVIYTAHWDAHGVADRPDANGDRIYHGARDNASGTAMLLELGRYFASQPRTVRSLLFIAVTGEEKGLLGSKYYAGAPLYPLERTAAAINTDTVLGAGRSHSVSTLGDSQNSLQDRLNWLPSSSTPGLNTISPVINMSQRSTSGTCRRMQRCWRGWGERSRRPLIGRNGTPLRSSSPFAIEVALRGPRAGINAWQDLIHDAADAEVIAREQRFTLLGLKHRGVLTPKASEQNSNQERGGPYRVDAVVALSSFAPPPAMIEETNARSSEAAQPRRRCPIYM